VADAAHEFGMGWAAGRQLVPVLVSILVQLGLTEVKYRKAGLRRQANPFRDVRG
jgi:hypothetical protein